MEEKRGNLLKCPECDAFAGSQFSGYCRRCYKRISNGNRELYINRPVYPGYGIKVNVASFYPKENNTIKDYGYIDDQFGYEKRGY